MRRTLALVVIAALTVVTAVVMGEYVLTGWTALAAGVVVGFLFTEVVLGIAAWRAVTPALFTGACGGVALAWAGWIESGRGVVPIRTTVWLGVAVAVAVGVYRLRPRVVSD